MFSNLFEDNKNIDNIIHYLNKKIVDLRKSNKIDEETFNELNSFYKNKVNYYYDNYFIKGQEVDRLYEEDLINSILDLIKNLDQIK